MMKNSIFSLSLIQRLLLILTVVITLINNKVNGDEGDAELILVSGLRFYHQECHAPISTTEDKCVFNGIGLSGESDISEAASVLEDVAERQASCASTIASNSKLPSFVLTLGDLTQQCSMEEVQSFTAYYLGRIYASSCKNILSIGRRDVESTVTEQEELGSTTSERQQGSRIEDGKKDLLKLVMNSVSSNEDSIELFDWDETNKKGSLSYSFHLGNFRIFVVHDSMHHKSDKFIKGVGTITYVKDWLIESLNNNTANKPGILFIHDWSDMKSIVDWDIQLSDAISKNIVAVLSTVPAVWSKERGTVAQAKWQVDNTLVPVYVAGSTDEDRVTKVHLSSQNRNIKITYYDSSTAEECVAI